MTYRTAPTGFTLEQGDTFNCDDTVFVANVLTDQESDAYLDTIEPLTLRSSRYTEGQFSGRGNIVEESPIFANLIDYPRHAGYTYDIFGDMLKLHQNQIFISLPDDTGYNICHPDGACTPPHNRDDGCYHARVKLERGQRLTFAEPPSLSTEPLTIELEAEDRSSLMTL